MTYPSDISLLICKKDAKTTLIPATLLPREASGRVRRANASELPEQCLEERKG